MARPLWKGAISFGMVSIPVKLYSATEEKDVHFNQLHATDHARLKQRLFCAEEEVEVDRSEIVRGYEVTPGQYVVIEDEDFEKVRVSTNGRIDIEEFVKLEEIDPILYQKTYYLEPDDVGLKPFALLMRVLESSGLVAIAKVTMRQKEQLCSLRIYENTIALETLFYSDEVRSTEELSLPSEDIEVSNRDFAMAKSIVEMLTSEEFNFEQYKDDYRDALLEVIQKKAEGQTIEAPQAAPAKITDLTEALRASVEAIRKNKKVPAPEEAEDEETVSSPRRDRAKAS